MVRSTETTHSRYKARRIIAVSVAVIGAATFLCGIYLETRNPRTNAEDDFAWFVLALGTSMTAAGVAIPFARGWVVVLIALAAPFLGFSLAVVAFWTAALTFGRWPSQEQMVPSGYQIIPESRQIDDLLGPAWHRLSNYREPDIAEWQTEALFGGRYVLWMWVKIEVDRKSGNVRKVISEPRFVVAEVTRIRDHGHTIRFGGDSHEFGVEEWHKVVEANGDFSVIGFHVDRDNPVRGFAEYKKIPRNGIQMKADRNLPVDD